MLIYPIISFISLSKFKNENPGGYTFGVIIVPGIFVLGIRRMLNYKTPIKAVANVSVETEVKVGDHLVIFSKNKRWKLKKVSHVAYHLTTPITLSSFGEYLTIEIEKSATQQKITVSSKPLLSNTLFDYGKNNQNINEVISCFHFDRQTKSNL